MQTNPLTLETLEVIDQIERRGSFASAAEHLNKVPSALSYTVQRLEEQLGVTIFQRQGRRSVLTPAGKHLLLEGRLLLESAHRLAQQTREVATGWEPRIRIAVDTILDPERTFTLLKDFLDAHPQIEIDLTEEALGGGWEALIDDRVDLLVGASPPVPPQQGIRSEALMQLQMTFVVARQHPLASSREPLSQASLSQQRWVVVHDTSRYSAPRDTGRISSSQRIYVQNITQKIAAQVAGVGIGYLPSCRIRHLLQRGELVEIPLQQPAAAANDLLIGWKVANKGKGLRELVQLFRGGSQ